MQIDLWLIRCPGDAASAFGDFEAAIRHNQDDPDIYYHRGQGEQESSSLSHSHR
jgi:hypothetical protein